jgi:hypothetical protein
VEQYHVTCLPTTVRFWSKQRKSAEHVVMGKRFCVLTLNKLWGLCLRFNQSKRNISLFYNDRSTSHKDWMCVFLKAAPIPHPRSSEAAVSSSHVRTELINISFRQLLFMANGLLLCIWQHLKYRCYWHLDRAQQPDQTVWSQRERANWRLVFSRVGCPTCAGVEKKGGGEGHLGFVRTLGTMTGNERSNANGKRT